MSYDPDAYHSNQPPEHEDAIRSDLPPDYDYDEQRYDRSARIKARVQAPAICLIVLGILNLFWALYLIVNGVAWAAAPDFLINAQKNLSPAFENSGATREEQQMQGIVVSFPLAFLALLSSVLSILGGFRMLSLRSYPLSICGAISAMVPCLSCMACCGVGEAIGIWALIVLVNEEVKAAFR